MFTISKKQRTILWVSLAVAVVLTAHFSYIIYTSNTPLVPVMGIFGLTFSFSVTYLIFSGNIRILDYLQRRYPWQKNAARRVTLELVFTSLNATTVVLVMHMLFGLLFSHYVPPEYRDPNDIYINILISNTMNLIITGIYEGSYLLRSWKQSLTEAERLKRESTESQLLALRNQMTPHFLFNSLNALASLISTEPAKAEEFVSKFARIYRYVLDIQDKTLVTLNEELEFLSSFFLLHKIRFGDNLNMTIRVDAQRLNDYIVPLALQNLLENAMKHNEISSKHPLTIEIFNTENELIVSNNLNPKAFSEYRSGLGLKNLKARYEHFTNQSPVFYSTENQYIAKIPLLKEDL